MLCRRYSLKLRLGRSSGQKFVAMGFRLESALSFAEGNVIAFVAH